MFLGPGSIIENYLRRKLYWISSGAGCAACNEVAAEMDAVGPTNVRDRIDYFTNRMHASSREWMKQEGGIWRPLEKLPRRVALRRLILWACDESEATIDR